MKKHILLIGFLTLTVACNAATATPEPESTPMATLLPTPLPATATPTFPPAPTDTPLPPRYFTEEFDASSPFWQFLQSGGSGSPSTTFENGTLRINIPTADTWYMGLHTANSYSNIAIRAKVSANTAGSIGLICRYDESAGWFEFNIDHNASYSILLGEWLAPGVAKYTPVASSASNHIPIGNLNSEIGLYCQDNILNLYVNGTVIRRMDVTNYGLTDGQVGITAASYREAPMSAVFEWVQVSEE